MIDALVEPCSKCGRRTDDMYRKNRRRFCLACLSGPDQMAEFEMASGEIGRAIQRFDAALRVACDPGPWLRGDQ